MRHGGCILVDSTAKGKAFPDSFAKTVPIWACVMNRLLAEHRASNERHPESLAPDTQGGTAEEERAEDWDEALHLPPWVPASEAAQIEALLPGWVDQARELEIDFGPFAGHALPLTQTLALSRPPACSRT